MSKVVNCECGEIVRAESDGELVTRVEAHVERNHPDMVGKLSRDQQYGPVPVVYFVQLRICL